jgi:hypothetical protein
MNSDYPLSWLLEPDSLNPGVRYFALRDLLDAPADSPEVLMARELVMTSGPVPEILAHQQPGGYWNEPGYWPKYTGTMWSVPFLAQLGADGDDPRIRQACEHLLEYTPAASGGLSMNGRNSGLIHCLQGNLLAALIDFGWSDDERVQRALEWLARSITGEGIAPNGDKTAEVRYLRSGNSGPGFECSANNFLACAWGAIKAMLALSKVPTSRRTPAINRAIEAGVEFLFSRDPARADYPMGFAEKPNTSWFKFGYPVFYITDVLQNLEVLAGLGYGADPRMGNGLELLLSKRDKQGRWPMEYTYNGKTWVDIEQKGKPSKWVTLRAVRVLKEAGVTG